MDTPLDFSKYELDALGIDIRSVVNIPGAIKEAATYAFTLPFVVALITWAVFSSRMASWVLAPFVAVAFTLAFGASLVLGGYFVTRKRSDTVVEASGRVVKVVGDMHADIDQLREGHAETSVQKVATGLLESAIFPAVFGTLTATAENSMGPLGRLASRVTKAPLHMVQKSVISAIEALPDKQIGQLAADLGDRLPDAATNTARLSAEYAQIRDKMENIVGNLSRAAVRSVIGLGIAASIPVVMWLILGWVLS